MEENKQPFEHSERLRDIIKWFAANVPCPGAEWNQLITAINTALTDLQQQNAEQAAEIRTLQKVRIALNDYSLQQFNRIAELEKQLKDAKEHIARLNKIDSERGTY